MPESFSIIDDLSNPRIKSRVIAQIGALQGLWRIEVVKYRPRRTDRQNRFMWPCFVEPFARYLVEEGHEYDDPKDVAHEILKGKFLNEHIVDEKTGEVFSFTRSTTTLTTVEFNRYLDSCAKFLAELGIVVPEPSIYHEPIEQPTHGRAAAGKEKHAIVQ